MASFAIEVPAEANPLTNQSVYHVLQSATSNNQHQIQSGTKQLQNWEKSPGFYNTLQSIYLDTSLPGEVRYLAIIQLKNAIDKYWRKTATNVIGKEEKTSIRSRCLESCLREPNAQFALQSAVMVARIVRYDYPQDWPEALPSILKSIELASQTVPITYRLSRSLLVLLYIIKELSTARLQRSRFALQSAAPGIVAVLFSVYAERVQKWVSFLHSGGDDEGGAIDSMEQSFLALRVLRRLIIQYDFPNRHEDIQNIWGTVNNHFADMLALVSGNEASALLAASRIAIEKHLIQISKLHLNMVKSHPAAFALLPDSVLLVKAYWSLARQISETYGLRSDTYAAKIGTDGDPDGETPFQERLTLRGLLLLRAVDKMVFNPIQTFKYQQAEDKEEKKIARELMRDNLLDVNLAQEIMETLVTRFFVFTSRDLKQWEDEPDEWEKTQEGAGDDWEYSIRTCAEKLFLDLIINFKKALAPSLLIILQKAGIQDTDSVFGKDSIYAAIGLAAPVLDQSFDFAAFLQHSLAPEVQIQKPGCNILRRRVAIVLGQWLPVREGLDRSLVYQIFQHLLDSHDVSNDQVVRVTAGRQLYNIINPFEFTAEGFMPFASTIVERLMALIQEVELPETKMALLNTISVIVVRMESHISPFADQIISLLPPLWEQAGQEYLTKQSILGIISALVTSLQSNSQKYQPLIAPIIESSIIPESDTRAFLLEDALDLWAAILEQTPSPTSPEVLALAQYLVPNLETASDACRKALDITEAYIYLIPSEILSDVTVLLDPFTTLLKSLKREATEAVTLLVELLICSADILANESEQGKLVGSLPMRNLVSALTSSGFLETLLIGLRQAHDAHQTTGPNATSTSIDGVLETYYFNVLARLIVACPIFVVEALLASSRGPYLDWLLTEWFDHMDNISHPAQKKLNTLALTALLDQVLEGDAMLLRLQSLISLWTETITELVIEDTDLNGNILKRDCLVYSSPDVPTPEEHESQNEFRKRKVAFADPVHRIDIRDFVRQIFKMAVGVCGGMDLFVDEWLTNVDRDVVDAFGELGIL